MAAEKSTRHHHRPAVETFSAHTAEPSDNELVWDWQLVSMVLAVAACLLFFVGTALVSINYIRQWRKIKKQFDNGELSHLAETFQPLDGLIRAISKQIPSSDARNTREPFPKQQNANQGRFV